VIEKIKQILKDVEGLVGVAKPVTLEVGAFILLLIFIWRLLSGEFLK
jgi:hypothetical protein